MAATTLATFYNTYKNLSITGVTSLSYPPSATDLTTAKMPCKWLDSLGISEEQLRAKSAGGMRTLSCRMIVAVAAPAKGSHEQRWSDTLTMVDTVNAAIKTVAAKRTEWTIEAVPDLADKFFAVVVEITQPEGII